MAERKVISKYYPPEFDPSLLPKRSQPKNSQVKIRMMLPMSVRCTVCGEFMGVGKKFNARKETVEGENYLTLKTFRFYIRCTKCSSELTFKTDPKNSTYVAEKNCIRNYTPWSNSTQDEEEQKLLQEQEEGDSMKQLENRTMEMKHEMDLLDDLDELRSISAQNQKVSIDQLLAMNKKAQLEEKAEDALLTEEDRREIENFEKEAALLTKRSDHSGISSSTITEEDSLGSLNGASNTDNSSSNIINFRKRKLDSLLTSSETSDNNDLLSSDKATNTAIIASTSNTSNSGGNLFGDSTLVVKQPATKKAKTKPKKSKTAAKSALSSLVSNYD